LIIIFLAGTSKGIGLGLVKQFLQRTNAKVVATCRDSSKATELKDLLKQFGSERLIIENLDTQKPEDFKEVYDKVSSAGISKIDVLIGNAGISNPDHPHDPILTTDVEDMMNVYRTNCVGNLLLLQTFHSMLSKSDLKLAVLVSSIMGSYTDVQERDMETTAYRASKAALNMIGVVYASDKGVKDAGIKLMLTHPGTLFHDFSCFHTDSIGHVETEMGTTGGQHAKVDIDESSGKLVDLIERASVYQLKANSSIIGSLLGKDKGQGIQFTTPPEEIEKKGEFNEMIEHLQKDNFVFVEYTGKILEW
jgi:NAD(P)-dependent dehydrogenase (short-subunit alcohol dehydrogenase family)